VTNCFAGDIAAQFDFAGLAIAGRYRVVEQLGESRTRVVYLTRTDDEHTQVVQLLRPTANSDERARFLDDAERLRGLAHVHIIRSIETGCDGDSPFVVYEHLRGVPLATLAERGGLHVRRAVHIARQVAAAIGAAHVEGILHGGVGIDSVFLVERAGDRHFVKLLGFGASERPDVPAPEQLLGDELDPRSDVWAVGALLYRMLTGHGPFTGAPGSPAWRNEILTAAPVQLLRSDVPRDLHDVILRCLAKDPADRYEDMAAVVAALGPFQQRFPRGSLTLPPPIINPLPRSTEPIIPIPTPAPRASIDDGPQADEPRPMWQLIAMSMAALAGCVLASYLA
jgi:eukaryotic-like serine/threonine-protein kinase